MSSIDAIPPPGHGQGLGSEPCRTRREAVQPLDQDVFERVIGFVDQGISGKISIDDLSALADLGRSHFSRRFKLKADQSPYAFIVKRRMELARQLLEETDCSCERIAEQVGFTHMAHFRTQFRRYHGNNPSEVRRTASIDRLRAEQK